MKVFEAGALLVVGTVLMTFTAMCYLIHPRPLTLTDPGLLMEAVGIAGLLFAGMGVWRLFGISRMLNGEASAMSAQRAVA